MFACSFLPCFWISFAIFRSPKVRTYSVSYRHSHKIPLHPLKTHFQFKSSSDRAKGSIFALTSIVFENHKICTRFRNILASYVAVNKEKKFLS